MKYVGMNYQDWCALDEQDERRINYSLIGIIDGERQAFNFTSDDKVDGLMMHRIRNSTIKELHLIDNEWYVTLNYLI